MVLFYCEEVFFFLKFIKKAIIPTPKMATAPSPRRKKVSKFDDRGGITTSGVGVKVADPKRNCVAVKVGVMVGGIEVLVFAIVGFAVIVEVATKVEVAVAVEVEVAVGGSVGTVWGSNPPQTTFLGIKRNNKRKLMSGNSFNPNCLFISFFPVLY
jgi:hypothetical protein